MSKAVLNSNSRTDLKIIIVGNSGTGKTSFALRWGKNQFNETYKTTIVSEFSYKIYEYKGFYYRIYFWDLAGQDKSIHTSKVFLKDSHGYIIMCDITNPDSLETTLKWKKVVDENAKFIDGGELPSILIQNKIDLVPENEMPDIEDVQKFAEKNGFSNLFRTSAKTGQNVGESMDYLIHTIIDRLDAYSKSTGKPITRDRNNIVIETEKKDKTSLATSKKCCGYL